MSVGSGQRCRGIIAFVTILPAAGAVALMAAQSHRLLVPAVVRLHRALSLQSAGRQKASAAAVVPGTKRWDGAAEFAVVKLEELVLWARKVPVDCKFM